MIYLLLSYYYKWMGLQSFLAKNKTAMFWLNYSSTVSQTQCPLISHIIMLQTLTSMFLEGYDRQTQSIQ